MGNDKDETTVRTVTQHELRWIRQSYELQEAVAAACSGGPDDHHPEAKATVHDGACASPEEYEWLVFAQEHKDLEA